MQVRQLISKHVEESVPQHDTWKLDPHAVTGTTRAYLEILAPVIEAYINGLVPPEKDVIDLIIAGKSRRNIGKLHKIQKAGVTGEEIRKYEYEFMRYMIRACVWQLSKPFCPFCHGGLRWNGSSPHPRLFGIVCPHVEIWQEQEMEEGKE